MKVAAFLSAPAIGAASRGPHSLHDHSLIPNAEDLEALHSDNLQLAQNVSSKVMYSQLEGEERKGNEEKLSRSAAIALLHTIKADDAYISGAKHDHT